MRFAASNVALDCKGSTINGTGIGFGIYISKDVQHVTIKNCTIRNYRYGVYVDGSSGYQLPRNVLTANGYGIVLGFAANSEVISNTVDTNEYAGIYVEGSSENQIRGNTTQSNGGMGIFLHTSMNNDVSSNQSCFNTYLDFDVYSSVSAGDNNTCDTPDIWNDAGAAGCTLACPKLLQQIYLPLVAR